MIRVHPDGAGRGEARCSIHPLEVDDEKSICHRLARSAGSWSAERFVKALIDKIEESFSDTVYPGDANLTDSKYGEEPEALVEDFRGKDDWKSLEPGFLNQAPGGWGSALSFFSAAALQFYLPAYLITDIRGMLECGDATTRLCAFLTPQMETRKIARFYGGGTLGEHARAEFDRFTPEQVSAIVAYLWWKLDTEGYNPTIEQALEHYWLEREARSMQTD